MRERSGAHHEAADGGGVVALGAARALLRPHALGEVREEVPVEGLGIRVAVAAGGRHEGHVVPQEALPRVLPAAARYAAQHHPAPES